MISSVATVQQPRNPKAHLSGVHSREKPYRVFLMQNHPLMVLGTSSFLNRQDDFSVASSATTPAAALISLARTNADVVIVELSITGPFDFPFLKKLRAHHPSLPILAFSYHEEVIFARRALEAGANGYLMKEAEPDKLADALRQILAGHIYMSGRVKARIAREQMATRQGSAHSLNGARVNSLTIRELRIFQCLGDGFLPARIQDELQMTPAAFASACQRMRKKLDLARPEDLVQFASHWAYYEGDFS